MSSSANTNVVVLTGNLVRDAELKEAGSAKFLVFSIAVNEKTKKGDNWEDYANYFDVSLFGKRGEALFQYMKKGTRVAVEGSLHQDRWEKDGKKQNRIVVRADNLELIGGKKSESGSGDKGNTTVDNNGFPDDCPF